MDIGFKILLYEPKKKKRKRKGALKEGDGDGDGENWENNIFLKLI